MKQTEKMYMNAETGSVDNYKGWDYENENGETVNAVELGEVFEVVLNDEGEWVEGEFKMDYENLTREQAVAIVGEELVKSVESENCNFTNRVMNSDFVEFSASVRLEDDNPLNRECLIAYYYQKSEDVNATEDLGSLTWEIDHFEIC